MADEINVTSTSADKEGRRWFSLPASPSKLKAHASLDLLSEVLIYAMIIFSPWAFGTTETWSMNCMNGMAYGLGVLLVMKLLLRLTSGEGFARWNRGFEKSGGSAPEHAARLRSLTFLLLVLTIFLLGYCWVSVANARSTYNWEARSFDKFPSYIPWLPASFDQPASVRTFWNYLALALAFWGILDWLLGKTARDMAAGHSHKDDSHHHARRLPDRLRRLLWVLTINGGLLALEGIAQRWVGTGELLFFRRPSVTHFGPLSQFGPYAYRSNACQYLCILWPVSLGFWWSLQRMAQSSDFSRRRLARGRILLLISVILMAVAPLISSSRLGAATTVLLMAGAVAVLHSAMHGARQKAFLWFSVILIFAGGLGFGWKYFEEREKIGQMERSIDARVALGEAAEKIAEEYPVFGTGPGTFRTVYQFYRPEAEEWLAQVHNDYLETVVTFGWVGAFALASTFVVLLVRWLIPGGIGAGRRFPVLLWMGLGSCLFQARWDFPFQVYSVLFAFLTISAIAFVITRRRIE